MTVFDFAKALVPMGMVISTGKNSFDIRHNLKTVKNITIPIGEISIELLDEILNDCKHYYNSLQSDPLDRIPTNEMWNDIKKSWENTK